MGRRFITARDVDDVIAAGRWELRLDAGDRLTDLARERARDRGVALVEAGGSQTDARTDRVRHAPVPAPAARPAPTPTASDGGPSHDGTPPRRQLRAAVRAGVVAEFGGAPEGIDAAIGRVFDRLGIRDE